MLVYFYMKHFGLSYEETMNEPYRAFARNMEIARAENEYMQRQQKAEERLGKIGDK